MISKDNNITELKSLRDYCWEKVKGKGMRPYFHECTIGGLRFGKKCSSIINHIKDKLYLQMSYTKELDNPHLKYLQKFSYLLNYYNGTFIPLGDSQMTSFKIGLGCENQFRDSKLNIAEFSREYQHYVNFLRPHESVEYFEKYISNLYLKHSHIFLLVNFGVHYNDKADNAHQHVNSKDHFMKNYPIVLNWLNRLGTQKNITIAWIETYPQHFPTPNGYYQDDLNISGGCSPIPLHSTPDDWRNDEIRYYFKKESITNIYYISTYEIFAPLHNEHYELDCTHYCWSPMLYQPIYKELYRILKKDLNKKNMLPKDLNNTYFNNLF